MQSTNKSNEVIEDYEPLLELRAAFENGDKQAFEGVLEEISTELADEYRVKIDDKVKRWASATVALRFEDAAPTRVYIQAKMLYRDGFYEATIMVARSIAEMFCYDRIDRVPNPFGGRDEIERKNFRSLLRWLHENDSSVNDTVFKNLNSLYDLGNNYVHPKAGHAKEDSLKALHLIGESLFEVYGVRGIDDLIGKTVRTPYADFPDICGGHNFLLFAFTSPQAALEHSRRHYKSKKDLDRLHSKAVIGKSEKPT
jgi:hypothetical protein